MKFTFKKASTFTLWLLGIISSVAIGGLFINGAFLNTVILSILPQIVHTIVGWLFVIMPFLGLAAKYIK